MEKIVAIVGGDGKMGTLVSTALNKKYKVEDVVDELPDSAGGALF